MTAPREGAHQGTPGLLPHERCNPGVYVTGRDFRAWEPGLVQAHGGELRQWARRDELSPTALAIAAVLSVFRGLRGGRDGCGVQMTLEAWGELLGRSRRMVAYAFSQLEEAGWVWRRRRLVKVDWTDANGVQWRRADVWGVAYLSQLAAVRIARRGETRRLVLKNGRSSRVLVAAGVVGNLLRTHARELRAIALRITDAVNRCTPSYGVHRGKTSNRDSAGARAPAPISRTATGPPSSTNGPSPPKPEAWADRGRPFLRELQRLRGELALTPALAWPKAWFSGDDGNRRWLTREFERYRVEVTRHVVAAAGPPELLELQRRIDAGARRLAALERTQPTRRQKAIAKYEARVRQFGRAVERLGRQLERRSGYDA